MKHLVILLLVLVILPGCSKPKHDEAFWSAVDQLNQISRLSQEQADHDDLVNRIALVRATIDGVKTTNHLAELQEATETLRQKVDLAHLRWIFYQKAGLAAGQHGKLFAEDEAEEKRLASEFAAFMSMVRTNR